MTANTIPLRTTDPFKLSHIELHEQARQMAECPVNGYDCASQTQRIKDISNVMHQIGLIVGPKGKIVQFQNIGQAADAMKSFLGKKEFNQADFPGCQLISIAIPTRSRAGR